MERPDKTAKRIFKLFTIMSADPPQEKLFWKGYVLSQRFPITEILHLFGFTRKWYSIQISLKLKQKARRCKMGAFFYYSPQKLFNIWSYSRTWLDDTWSSTVISPMHWSHLVLWQLFRDWSFFGRNIEKHHVQHWCWILTNQKKWALKKTGKVLKQERKIMFGHAEKNGGNKSHHFHHTLPSRSGSFDSFF